MSVHPNKITFAPEVRVGEDSIDMCAVILRAALETSPHLVCNTVRVMRVTRTEVDLHTGLYEQGDGELAWSGGEGSVAEGPSRGKAKDEYTAALLWALRIESLLNETLTQRYHVHYDGRESTDPAVIRIERVKALA